MSERVNVAKLRAEFDESESWIDDTETTCTLFDALEAAYTDIDSLKAELADCKEACAFGYNRLKEECAANDVLRAECDKALKAIEDYMGIGYAMIVATGEEKSNPGDKSFDDWAGIQAIHRLRKERDEARAECVKYKQRLACGGGDHGDY